MLRQAWPHRFDIEDVDLMTSDLMTNILSLGKVLRKGYSFHLLDGKNCYATTPGGGHRIQLQLGLDDILRMPHGVRTGTAANRVPECAGSQEISRGCRVHVHAHAFQPLLT